MSLYPKSFDLFITIIFLIFTLFLVFLVIGRYSQIKQYVLRKRFLKSTEISSNKSMIRLLFDPNTFFGQLFAIVIAIFLGIQADSFVNKIRVNRELKESLQINLEELTNTRNLLLSEINLITPRILERRAFIKRYEEFESYDIKNKEYFDFTMELVDNYNNSSLYIINIKLFSTFILLRANDNINKIEDKNLLNNILRYNAISDLYKEQMFYIRDNLNKQDNKEIPLNDLAEKLIEDFENEDFYLSELLSLLKIQHDQILLIENQISNYIK